MLAERGRLERLTIEQNLCSSPIPVLGLFDDPWWGELQLRFGHLLVTDDGA